MGFLSEQCTLRVLDREILATSRIFSCGHPDLDDFFFNEALDYYNQLIGKTYCFVLDDDPHVIVCAFTLSNDSIKTERLPNARVKRLRKNIPREKHMKSYPAVLIGRLGVNQEYKRRGIGVELMDFIKGWFIDPFNKTGCRYLVADSYNEKNALDYYQRNGFEFIFSSKEQEKANLGIAPEYELKTRFMYFDLIVLNIGELSDDKNNMER